MAAAVGSVEPFHGTLIANGGGLSVATTSNNWSLAGRLDLTQSGGSVPVLSGEKALLSGQLNVVGQAQILAPLDLSGNVSLASGAELELHGVTTFLGGTYSGEGELELHVPVTVAGNTTVSARRIDLDGVAETGGATILPGGMLLLDGGDLLVANPWTAAEDAVVQLQQAASNVPEIAGTTWTLYGTLNVDGRGEIDAPLALAATAQVNIASGALLVAHEKAAARNVNRRPRQQISRTPVRRRFRGFQPAVWPRGREFPIMRTGFQLF